MLKSASGERSARVQIEHPTLGSLRLDFALADGEVDVRVLAPGLMSAIRLERDADRIRTLLRENNVQLASLRVDIARSEPAPPPLRRTTPDLPSRPGLSLTA